MKAKMNFKKLTVAFLVAGILLVNFGFLWFYHSLSAVGGQREITLEITPNQTVDWFIERLAQEGIIRSKLAAKIMARMQPVHLRQGTYVFRSQDSLRNNLYRNTQATQAPIIIRFLEGEWSNGLAKKLAEHFAYSEEEILRRWNDHQYLNTLAQDFPFLRRIPRDANVRVALEGFLFPDTYHFARESTLDDITRQILHNTAQKYRQLQIDQREDLFDLVRMASLVQFEARTENEMRLVAGVFYNRLQVGQKLEASASVCYALGKYQSWKDCEWNIHVPSLYNTYYTAGLPVGAISNPGMQAFRATLNPQKSDYYYFISDSHGDGKMYFSRTFGEHQRLIEKYALKMKKGTGK